MIVEQGSMPVPALAARLDENAAYVGRVVAKSEWFVKENGEVAIQVRD